MAPDNGFDGPDSGFDSPDNGFGGPDDGAAGPDQSAFEAPPEQPSNGAPGAGPKPKKPGKADQGAADPDSPAEISQRLAAEAGGESAGHTRHGANGAGMSGVDEAASPSDGAVTDVTSELAAPGEAPELLPGFGEPTTAPVDALPDETTLDAMEPPLNQAGHTDQGNKKQALWVTAIAFGAVLLVSAGWLWTRRGPYDPA